VGISLIWKAIGIFGCLIFIFCVINGILNLLITYHGYDPRVLSRGWIIRKRWSFGLAALLYFVCMNLVIFWEQQYDYRPCPVQRSTFVGTWRKDAKEIQLNEDGTVGNSTGLGEVFKKANWSVEDSNCSVCIRDKEGDLVAEWRIMTKAADEYRLLDTDWRVNGEIQNYGFKKVKNSE